MHNFFEIIKEGLHFNKFEVDGNIAVEYVCPLEDQEVGLYSHSDYIIHILSGKKTWRTIEGKYVMQAGDTLYVKKGAAIVHQYFDENFCMLGFFISDGLIQETVQNIIGKTSIPKSTGPHLFTATRLKSNPSLEGFFQSMLIYFREKGKPLDYILKLKIKELIVSIISNKENASLASYFKNVAEDSKPSLPQIMESNFCYNLNLEAFAKLCHRSLSTFKRDFFNHYQTTPGKWLLEKRLLHAANLLINISSNITQVAFDSGFENVSHFSRAFKNHFGVSPSLYLKEKN